MAETLRGWVLRHRLDASRLIVIVITVATIVTMMLAHSSSNPGDFETTGTRNGLQAFEALGLLLAVYRLAVSRWAFARALDAAGLALSVALAGLGYSGIATTILGATLLAGRRDDHSRGAAGAVVFAISMQAVWAPALFFVMAPVVLPLDAGAAGSTLSVLVPAPTPATR